MTYTLPPPNPMSEAPRHRGAEVVLWVIGYGPMEARWLIPDSIWVSDAFPGQGFSDRICRGWWPVPVVEEPT